MQTCSVWLRVTVWGCVGLCGAVWGCVGLCGAVWGCVGLCGAVCGKAEVVWCWWWPLDTRITRGFVVDPHSYSVLLKDNLKCGQHPRGGPAVPPPVRVLRSRFHVTPKEQAQLKGHTELHQELKPMCSPCTCSNNVQR